jgi:murein L,D-transpeptidase YafK
MRARQRALLALLMGLAAIGIVWALYGDRIRLAIEENEIARDKARRLVRFRLGEPLPGTPDLDRLDERLKEKGLAMGAPVFIRIFKEEHELELWLETGGRFVLLSTYPICRWSGGLGPKHREGDRQSPEGFYLVGRNQLNPNSRWHRSFNLGFPNALDRSHGRTGSFLMVHGGCTSIGCYAMTDPVIDEIWRIVNAAFDKGQPAFEVHVFPFRMAEEKLARRPGHPARDFWVDLKPAYDAFEQSRVPPRIGVCQGRYVVATAPATPADDVLCRMQRASLH